MTEKHKEKGRREMELQVWDAGQPYNIADQSQVSLSL